MRFIIDINPDLLDIINLLIKEGKYRTVQEFVMVAIQNQLYVIERSDVPSVTNSQYSQSIKPIEQTIDLVDGTYLSPIAEDLKEIPITESPEKNKIDGELYGLWNRFFPVKITVRVLANMLLQAETNIPLVKLQENSANSARIIGKILVQKEKDMERKRGERLSTALPIKRNEYKAKARFKVHFVGLLGKNDHMSGMPSTLGLVNISRMNGRAMIGLTKYGLKLAKLPNPVLDEKNTNQALSDAEKAFLLEIIARNLPEETNKMKIVLSTLMESGLDSKEITLKVKEKVTMRKESEFNTFLIGMLSRLFELGLVMRSMKGLVSFYTITQKGLEFINKTPSKGD